VLTIDADAHVVESERTWDYLEGSDNRNRPVPITVDMPQDKRKNFWIIGGRLIGGAIISVRILLRSLGRWPTSRRG
jgi:hypothetical protein